MDIKKEAKNLLLKNYALTGGKYIAPDGYHKDQWLWDSCFHAIAGKEVGLTDLAKNEITRLLKYQEEDGFVPHQIYRGINGRQFGLERLLYKKKHGKYHSSITQPPVMAQAVEAINDPEWTQSILPGLVKFYLYFSQYRDPDRDGLISICLPTESGRDSSPDFNFCRRFNPAWFYILLWKLEWQYKRVGWNMERIWQKNLFNVEDVMFNCIWIEGLKSLYRLISAYGPENISFNGMKLRELMQHIKELADNSKEALLKLCWDEKDAAFYNLDSRNRKIRRLTVSGLFPLILDGVPEHMLKALVGHIKNPKEFWTPYPIPSVAANDPAFDPASGYFCNWRGPTWINMNWFIIKGLVKHGYADIAEEIADKTLRMVEREGFREFYNPLSGQGLRKPTRGFGWSTLVVTFPKILEKQKPES